MRARRLAAFGVGLMLFASVAACGGDDDDEGATGGPTTTAEEDGEDVIDPSREIRIITSGPPPGSWDPATFQGSTTQLPKFYNAVYDTLLGLNEDDELIPRLATEWEYDSTLTKLTLTLRDDVTFTDGAKFDAAAAKLNLDRVRTSSGAAGRLLAGITAIDAPSPTQLVVTQAAPNAKILSAMGSSAAVMASPQVIQTNAASLAQKPIGSGPFVLESVTQTSATFKRNDNYWDKETVFAAGMTITGAVDPNARINAIITGAVDLSDVSQEPPSADLVAKVEAGELNLVTVPGIPSMMGINTKIPPLDNLKVRQAINHAINREQISEVQYDGLCQTTSQLWRPGQPGYIEDLEYEYDVEKAKQLMQEAGVGEVSLTYQSTAGAASTTPELIADMLSKIGIKMNIVSSAIQEVFPNFFAGKFPLSALSLFVAMPDAAYVPDFITGPLNPGIKPPEVVELVNKAVALPVDDPDRAEAFEAVNQATFDNALVVPICYRPETFAAHPDVVGWDRIPQAATSGKDMTRLGLRKKS